MTGVLEHLERQVASSRRLLQSVMAQGEAIRRQDVEGVLARMSEVQAEMAERHLLELARDELLRTAASTLGTAPENVDLDGILNLVPADEAAPARERSAELRGLLAEIGRIHEQNRILIRQELTFLDHLMRVLSGTPRAGYSPNGWRPTPQPANALDARA